MCLILANFVKIFYLNVVFKVNVLIEVITSFRGT